MLANFHYSLTHTLTHTHTNSHNKALRRLKCVLKTHWRWVGQTTSILTYLLTYTCMYLHTLLCLNVRYLSWSFNDDHFALRSVGSVQWGLPMCIMSTRMHSAHNDIWKFAGVCMYFCLYEVWNTPLGGRLAVAPARLISTLAVGVAIVFYTCWSKEAATLYWTDKASLSVQKQRKNTKKKNKHNSVQE